MPTMMRWMGIALGVVALAVPLVSGGAMDGREFQACQPDSGACGEAIGALQDGGQRLVSVF